MSVPVPSTPTNPDDDLREQVANALADSNLREVGDDGTLVRPFSAKSPMAFAYADAALSVVNRVLEGLRAELETTRRMWEASARDNDRMAEERDEERQANSHETGHLDADRECMVQEIERLKRALAGHLFDGESLSTRDAIRLELIEQQHKRIHELLAEVARLREESRELAAELPCAWCKDTGIAPEETFGRDGDGAPMVDGDQPCPEGCRPSVSDQTPATPDDVDERPVVNRIADLIRSGAAVGTTATDTAREVWACLEMTGQLAAPSSVQGDTTPKEA